MNLNEKRALVTGGARGIGKGICKQLANAGASIIVADINYEGALQTANELKQNGHEAYSIKMDVSKKNEIEQVITSVIKEYGPIHIVVNNAGTITLGTVFEISEEEWNLIMDINAKGVFFVSQIVAKEMVKNGIKGRIINISSIGAKIPFENQAHYCASKAAVLGITRVFAIELAKYGITVNAICPGAVEAEILKKSYEWVALKTGQKPEEILESWLRPVPLGRLIKPEEIGDVVVFLCSDQAKTITGQAINVDGGRIFD